MQSGLDLGPGSLFTAMAVSTLGFGLFVYGKKQLRVPQLVVGIVLMALPFLVSGPLAMLGATSAVVLGLWLGLRLTG